MGCFLEADIEGLCRQACGASSLGGEDARPTPPTTLMLRASPPAKEPPAKGAAPADGAGQPVSTSLSMGEGEREAAEESEECERECESESEQKTQPKLF